MPVEDLTAVQTAADRKTACDLFIARDPTAMAVYYSQMIKNWCDSTIPTQPQQLVIPIMVIDSAVLDQWEIDLASRGYTITIPLMLSRVAGCTNYQSS